MALRDIWPNKGAAPNYDAYMEFSDTVEQAIDDNVVGGTIDEDGHLLLEQRDGSFADAGPLPPGPEGPTGAPGGSDESFAEFVSDPGTLTAAAVSAKTAEVIDDVVPPLLAGKQNVATLDADTAALAVSGTSALGIAIENLIGGYEPETLALFARMDVRPNADRRAAINALIVDLKSWGTWDKLDSLWVMAAHTAQAGLLNWRSTNRDLTAVNSPSFVVDQGFAGDGSTSYVRTGDASMAGLHFTPTSSTLGVWSLTDSTLSSSGRDIVIGNSSAGTSTHSINIRTTSVLSWQANQSQRTITQPNSLGLRAASRRASDVAAFVDGAQVDTAALAAPSTATFSSFYTTFGRAGSTYSTRRYALGFWGGALTNDQHAALYNSFADYLDAVGAI